MRLLLIFFTLFSLNISSFDIAINSARVIDPESNTDKLLNVGIENGRIIILSESLLTGKNTIDAKGYVVAPGFIDIHSHTPTPLGQKLNILDGITTQLDTEAGAYPVLEFGSEIVSTPRINFGASVGHYAARIQVIEGIFQPYFFHNGAMASMSSLAWEKVANDVQIEEIRAHLITGLNQGGIGIGLLLDYMRDAISTKELRMIFEVASMHNVPVFTHVKRNLPGDIAGLDEILMLAKDTGTSIFICHITHSAMGGVTQWLQRIEQAREEGINIATETLSYLAGGTSISADVFRKRDWQMIFDISYEDVQWAATGEWLTEKTWNNYSKNYPNGAVNHHYLKEEWLHEALTWPDMMISTDAIPAFTKTQFSNPNISGTFARVLGRYVREQNILSLSEALSKMSLKQAQWLEGFAPSFRKKGRVQIGMDADLVIFDPNTVSANATYGSPYEASSGIHWVIVNGELAVKNGKIIPEVAAGKRITTLKN
jgi:dihydroorotase-like cyclic amidohydrolase